MKVIDTRTRTTDDVMRGIWRCGRCDDNTKASYVIGTDWQGYKIPAWTTTRPMYCLRHAEDRAAELGKTYTRQTEVTS